MKNTCERLTLGCFPLRVEEEHINRYLYAKNFVKNKVLLDVACGTGYGSKILAKDGGAAHVLGIDISSDAISFAINDKFLPKNIDFKHGDAEKLDTLADSSFDMVVSFETIEHLRNIDLYLDGIFRILKPNGFFIVSTPDRRLASTLYPLRGKPNNPFHIQEFTKIEFEKILQNKGFKIVELVGQGYVHIFLVFWPIQVALKTVCYLFRKFGAYKFIDKFYHFGSGLHVHNSPRKFMIANYWVAYCVKENRDV